MHAKVVLARVIKFALICVYLAEAFLKGLRELGGQGKSFTEDIGLESLEIGFANICGLFWHFGRFLGGLGVVFGLRAW